MVHRTQFSLIRSVYPVHHFLIHAFSCPILTELTTVKNFVFNISSDHLSSSSKRLCFGLAVRVQIRLLAYAHNTVTKALAQSLVVKSSRMRCAAIIPNSYDSIVSK